MKTDNTRDKLTDVEWNGLNKFYKIWTSTVKSKYPIDKEKPPDAKTRAQQIQTVGTTLFESFKNKEGFEFFTDFNLQVEIRSGGILYSAHRNA